MSASREPLQRRALEGLQTTRGAWLILGFAMVASATLILAKGAGLSFSGDDLYYYARLVDHGVENSCPTPT